MNSLEQKIKNRTLFVILMVIGFVWKIEIEQF